MHPIDTKRAEIQPTIIFIIMGKKSTTLKNSLDKAQHNAATNTYFI